MGWAIHIESETLPNPNEPISSVCDCPGNFYTAVRDMKTRQLREMETEEALNALSELITELDKNDLGFFSNEWCKNADQAWSQGRETREEYSKWINCFNYRGGIPAHMPFSDYVSFCGYTIRDNIRNPAVRFFLYYKAGYHITYNW